MITEQLYEYYKEYTLTNTKYVLLSKESFNNTFKDSIILFDNNALIIGNTQNEKAYISIFYGTPQAKTNLLTEFENQMRNQHIRHIYFHFLNPIGLSWYPLKDIVHPGYQGVILNSENHQLLNKLGYKDNSIQDTYYLDLESFDQRDDLERQLEINSKNNLHIDFYNISTHSSLYEFTKELKHPGWYDAILNRNKMPLIVALFKNKVIGFTGPLKVETTKRGYFAGIGVLEEYRGYKLGKLLFYTLCKEHKKLGSKYLTLFTGRTNYAKKIYLDMGCNVVESFMTLIKEL